MRPGVDLAADQSELAGPLGREEHRDACPGWKPELRVQIGKRERVSVARQDPEFQALDFEIEERIGAYVADLPDLRLPPRHRDRRIPLTVDRLRLRGVVIGPRQLNVLEDQNPFLCSIQRRIPVVDEAVDHEDSRQAAEHLSFCLAVCMRVIPERALIVILGDPPPVVEDIVVAHRHPGVGMHERRTLDHLERRYDEVDVVGRRPWRDAHSVIVEVRGLRLVNLHVSRTNPVDQPQLQLVAAPQAENWWGVLAVVDVRGERPVLDCNHARRRLERQCDHAAVCNDHLWLEKRRAERFLRNR